MSKNKPLVIRLKEAEENISSFMNELICELDLSYCLIKPMIAELHSQVNNLAAREYELAKKQLEEEKAKKGGEG